MSKAAELAALIGSQTALSNRNMVINGAMTVDQRNGGSSVTPTADQTYVLDRFGAGLSVASKFSLEQTTTVPAGFENSMKATVVSAYTPGSAEWFGFFHKVEGLNASHLDFGTSDAKTLTLSFWVRSSVTGDYGFSLANSAQNRAYPVLYNISAADTWEHKTITIAGDTSGTWLTTNGIGLNLLWSLGAGSSYLQTANAWGTGLGLGTTGQTNWITNASATFYITGVQLEVGETATPFEHRSFGDELKSCERYYEKTYEYGTVPGTVEAYPTNMGMRINGLDGTSGQRYMVFRLRTEKRARPTNTYYGHSGNSGKISTADAAGTLTERDIALGVTSTSMVGGGSANGAYAGLMLYVVSDAEL